MKKTCSKEARDAKGRFLKGVSGNPKGMNQFTSLVPLIEALRDAGKERKEDFWHMVAKRVWTNETVLIAVLKKILPDKIQGEGLGDRTTIYNIIQQIQRDFQDNSKPPLVVDTRASVDKG